MNTSLGRVMASIGATSTEAPSAFVCTLRLNFVFSLNSSVVVWLVGAGVFWVLVVVSVKECELPSLARFIELRVFSKLSW